MHATRPSLMAVRCSYRLFHHVELRCRLSSKHEWLVRRPLHMYSHSGSAFNVFRFDTCGEFEEQRCSKQQLLRQTSGLHARDLALLLDVGRRGPRPNPGVLVRPTSILVSFSNIRALVQHDSMLLFHPEREGVSAFARDLGEYLADPRGRMAAPLDDAGEELNTGDEREIPPFEFLAIEGILSMVLRQYYGRSHLLHVLVNGVLHRFQVGRELRAEDNLVRQLLPMKDALSRFEIETNLARKALSEVLHSDEDLLGMLLTERQARQGELPPMHQHAMAELLLENFHSQMTEVSQEAYYLRKKVEGVQSILELELDAYRNRVLQLTLQLAVASVALASGTTLAGLFGMNLTSGIENHPVAFYWVCGASGASMAALYFGILARNNFASRPEPALAASAAENSSGDAAAVRSVFGHLNEVQTLLAKARRADAAGNGISRDELRDAMAAISGDLTEPELNLLFDAFDIDQSGLLEGRELGFAERDAIA